MQVVRVDVLERFIKASSAVIDKKRGSQPGVLY